MSSPKGKGPRKGVTPLDYMLAIVNDPDAAPARRDRMAVVAARYCHARPDRKGKKGVEAEAAEQAGAGWAGDLEYLDGRLRQ